MVRLLFISDFTENFPHQILQGIMDYSRRHEPWVVCRMPPSYKELNGVKGVLDWALEWKADAVIAQFNQDDDVEIFGQHGIIAIAQDYKERFGNIPNITSDYFGTGKMVADFFIDSGYLNFAYYGYSDAVWSYERCAGFRRQIERRLGSRSHFSEYNQQYLGALWSSKMEPTAEWLRSLHYPVALMACDDNQGNKLAEICAMQGINVPEQVAIVGVDNDDVLCNLTVPSLSSVKLDVVRAGYETAAMIDAIMHDPDVVPHDILYNPIKVIDRVSTAPFLTDDISIQRAVKFIHSNFLRRMSVDEIAREAALSRRLLEGKFKKETGKTIYGYLSELRLGHVAERLLSTNESIESICSSVADMDPKNVARRFRQFYGCTPSQYRKNGQGKHSSAILDDRSL